MVAAPVWTEEQLRVDLEKSIDIFREQRVGEIPDDYGTTFDECLGEVEELLEATVDLTREEEFLEVIKSEERRGAFRYLAGPPVSEDDWKTIARARLSRAALTNDPEMAKRVVETVMNNLDRHRFVWMRPPAREPTDSERSAAILATASLMAMRRTETARRNAEGQGQEGAVKYRLEAAGLERIDSRDMSRPSDFPLPGQFCGESLLYGNKADVVVRLYDERLMAIECKASNSSINSKKRLNREAAAKATAWKHSLGAQVVPAVVLSGVYKLEYLQLAQNEGLAIFWSHDLDRLTAWVNSTKS